MQVLVYDALDSGKIKGFKKFCQFVEKGNFVQADIKKVGDNLYRAKLNQKDRLLFSFYVYQKVPYCLVLEYLPNHAYDKSRFLAGAVIEEDKLPSISKIEEKLPELVYLNPENSRFQYLDKILSFDDFQDTIYKSPLPAVIVGSAGSGKTALMLEKMKHAVGDVLYVSHSSYLVQNSHQLYYSCGYQNELQEDVNFLSFKEYLETIHVPQGNEITQRDFNVWFYRQNVSKKLIKDGHKLFEEFRGVMTGFSLESPYLSKEEYLSLGVKQSLFSIEDREQVYALFERYLKYLSENQLYDSNIISQQYLAKVTLEYDFVVIDEVQDITNIQLLLILKSLRNTGDFILCGDANQIVHPNFFSWSKLKSLFFEQQSLQCNHEILHILNANYRNSALVTNVANRILKLKHARFGSVDKESNFLVTSIGERQGQLQLLENSAKVINKLDESTARSTKFAVLVLHQEQKAEATKLFSTPLVFSIQEAKGLEYDNIILYNFISSEEKAYRDIAADVNLVDLEVNDLAFSRAKSKQDKSLEVYKFYINALYVAITRAVQNLYVVESALEHPLMALLDLNRFIGDVSVNVNKSSQEEWQQEARRLELQGKQEQATAIRTNILKQKSVPWTPISLDEWQDIKKQVTTNPNKKNNLLAFEYALLQQDYPVLNILADNNFKPAIQWRKDNVTETKMIKSLYKNHFMLYDLNNANGVLREVDKYGVDYRTRFNLTPMMTAAMIGNNEIVNAVAELGGDNRLLANNGLNAWQMALGRAIDDEQFASKLPKMYKALAPDTISIQVNGKLEKLDELTMYGFLFNVFFALWYRKLGTYIAAGSGITAANLEPLLAQLPDTVLPQMKKKRAYISRYLSSNEASKDEPRNKRIFQRVKRGHYILNPDLKIRITNEWRKLSEVLSFDGLGYKLDIDRELYGQNYINNAFNISNKNLVYIKKIYTAD